MNSSKAQQSKIAKENHELSLEIGKVKGLLEKAENQVRYAEDSKYNLSQEVKTLQVMFLKPLYLVHRCTCIGRLLIKVVILAKTC